MAKKPYYITTPIYYPSGNWHIGHCYTTVVCDALARFHKLMGEEVFFLTGTDEHGQKVEKEAKKRGITPLEFIDPLVAELKDVWKMLDIDYDRFIRTTDEDHVKCVQRIYQKLYDKGEIYKSEYTGWYCTPCEAFWTEGQLKNGKCPDCGREVTLQKEESYFFRLSKYAPRILELYENHPEFLQPKSRVNEMVNNFLKAGLTDLCVSRTTVKWGVPLPFDKKHCSYVWIDALSNYISALGYASGDDSLYKKFWPADLHLVGKEIVRFHAIVWPAILMALGEPVPKQIYGHGWLLIGGEKLSKSKENARPELTDPYELVKRYGADAVRYYMLREIPFGSDGEYTTERFLVRINADLANDLGNLVSRTSAMIVQNFGVLPACGEKTALDLGLEEMASGLFAAVKDAMDSLNAPEALEKIFAVIDRANKYIDETTPWILAKDPAQRERLGTVLHELAEVCCTCAVLLKPFLTRAPKLILRSFSLPEETGFEWLGKGLKAGTPVEKLPPIFPRIDVKKELAEVEKIVAAKKAPADSSAPVPPPAPVPEKERITIEDFSKVELKIGEVIACERVPRSDKLLHETVKIGDEVRSIVSGIAAYYSPEEMVGKKVVLVTNLKPVKLRGVPSEGMILCAEDEAGNLSLLSPEKAVVSGAKVR